MQSRVVSLALGVLSMLWFAVASAGCAPGQVLVDFSVRRRPELSLSHLGPSLALVLDAPAAVGAVVRPEFERLVREGAAELSLVEPSRAALLFVVTDVRESWQRGVGEDLVTHTNVEGNYRVERTYRVQRSTVERVLRYRFALVHRATRRVLLEREWTAQRSSAGALSDAELERQARAAVAAQLAMLVAERTEQASATLTDCEGACGEGYDAMLAGRLAEADRHFRAAIAQHPADTRDAGAARAMRNLAACSSALGREDEAVAWARRAAQAERGEPSGEGERLSPMFLELREMRAAIARTR